MQVYQGKYKLCFIRKKEKVFCKNERDSAMVSEKKRHAVLSQDAKSAKLSKVRCE